MSETALLDAWTDGTGQRPARRALTLLAAGTPEADRDTLAQLGIGARNALLLELRGGWFGPWLDCVATCPECRENLEFRCTVEDLRGPAAEPGPIRAGELEVRPPTIADLIAVTEQPTAGDPRLALLRRCLPDSFADSFPDSLSDSLSEAPLDGPPLDEAPLDEALLATVSDALLAADPQAELSVGLCCGECGHSWDGVLDIGSYLWAEVDVWARRLLADVQALASRYGWSEADVLAVGPARRRFYLESVS